MVLHRHVVGAVVRTPDHARVLRIHTQSGGSVRVELDPPLLVVFVHEHIWLDVARRLAGHAGAGTGVERADQMNDCHQLVALQLQPATHLRLVLLCQQVEMPVDEFERLASPFEIFGQLAQLNQQAFAQITRRDTRRIEGLNAVQHCFDLFDLHVGVVHAGDDVFEGRRQVAVFADAVDDRFRDVEIGVTEWGQAHLPDEVIAQRLLDALLAEEVVPVITTDGPATGGCHAVVDVVPHRIDRQVVGHRLGLDLDLALVVGVVWPVVAGQAIAVEFFVGFAALALGVVPSRAFFLGLQHQVGFEGLLDLLLEFKRGQLQQLDSLLQLRRHGQVLAQSKLDRGLHSVSFWYGTCLTCFRLHSSATEAQSTQGHCHLSDAGPGWETDSSGVWITGGSSHRDRRRAPRDWPESRSARRAPVPYPR